MRRVSYASTAFTTDHRVADAIFEYARVLAAVDQADVVEVPGLDELGVPRTYQLIVGPASQIVAHDVDDPQVELDVEPVLHELRRRREHRLPQLDAADVPAYTEGERASDDPSGR